MPRKLLALHLLFLLKLQSANSVLLAASPQWPTASPVNGGKTFIPDASTSSHVTGIVLGLTPAPANLIYTLNILSSDGTLYTAQPDGGCTSLSVNKTFSFGENDRVVKIEAWRLDSDKKLRRIQITLQSSAVQDYQSPSYQTYPGTRYEFKIPAGQEFTGFEVRGQNTGCTIASLNVITRASVCTVNLDLSSVHGKSQNVIVDADQTMTFTATPSIDCGTASLSYQVTYSPSSTTPNLIYLQGGASTTIVFAKTNNIHDAQIYTVSVSVSLSGQSGWGSTIYTSNNTATYTYINLCDTTSLKLPDLQPMITSVLIQDKAGTAPYWDPQIVTPTNSVSENQSNSIFCGGYQYSISSVLDQGISALSTSELYIDKDGLIQLYTENSATVGIHTANVTASLINYPLIALVWQTFQITINQCDVKKFTISPFDAPQTYFIGNPAHTWSISVRSATATNSKSASDSTTVQVPACGYIQTLVSSSSASFIQSSLDGDSLSYSVMTRNVLDEGVQYVTVTTTLKDSPNIPVPSQKQSFPVTVINPCRTTTVTVSSSTIQNFVAFAGYSSTSDATISFNDTVSFANTLDSDTGDFCGEKQFSFQINETQTSWLSVNNNDFIRFSPPADTKDFGVGQSIFEVSMAIYPTIKKSFNFIATTLGSVVPLIANQKYVQGSSTLVIAYDPFQVLPIDYNIGPNTIEAFIFTGATLPEKIDPNCDCLTKVSDLDWITNDLKTNTFLVQTSNSSHVGVHMVVLVQSFENFQGVHPFAAFTITIDAEVIQFDIKKPPFFESPLLTQTVDQCSNPKVDLWSFNLPAIIDPQDSPVDLKVQLDESLFSYDSTLQKITQVKMFETSINETVKFVLVNAYNVSAVYSMKVQFICSTDVVAANYIPTSQKITQSKVKVQYPAQIASISRGGSVDVHFYQAVNVPNKTDYKNQSDVNDKRQLSKTMPVLSPDQLITKEMLSVQLQTKYTTKDIEWLCTGFSNQSIKIHVNFTNPLEISQDHQDKLILKFLQTDMFVLSARPEYLFQNESSKTLIINIPPQLPSNTTAAFFTTMSTSVQQVGVTVVVVTLLIQIVAKKVITSMWNYYCALQIVILLVLRSNMFPPASVDLIINAVAGIINLSSLDKKQIASSLHLDAITNSTVFQSLDGVALSAIGIIILLIVIGTLIVLSKKIPKVHDFFMKIKNTIFWNFLIRYFQASFIGFNFAALTVVQKRGGGLSDIGSSIAILIVQYCIVCFIAQFMLRKDSDVLNKSTTRSRIGNLYFNLDARNRVKLLFGLMFFVQRCLLVLLVALKFNFAVQWQLFQVVLLLNSAYILAVKPYLDPENATLDYVNCLFLLALCILTSTYSAWNTITYDRFYYGILFDALVGLQFIVNMAFVGRQIYESLILKAKQMHFRYKERKRLQTMRKFKEREAAEDARKVASLQGKIKALDELRTQAAKLKSKPQHTLSQQQVLRSISFDKNLQADSKVIEEGKFNTSELLESSEYSSDEQDTPVEQMTFTKYAHNTSKVVQSDESSFQNMENPSKQQKAIQMLRSNVSRENKEEIYDFQRQLVVNRRNQSVTEGTPNKNLAARSPFTSGQTILRSYLGNQFLRESNQQWLDQQIESIDSDRASSPDAHQQIAQLDRDERQKHQNVPKQNSRSIQNEQHQPHFINAKTKQYPLLSLPQWKVSPQSFNLKVTGNRYNGDFLDARRQFLERSTADYFASDLIAVRRYKQTEKGFTWVDDVWPFYKQKIEQNYSGPGISEEQHREHVKVHLYEQWIKEHPQMPYLPLLVDVDLYLKICGEIHPYVIQHLTSGAKFNY